MGSLFVALEVKVVAELVVDRDEVLLGRLDAHLDAEVPAPGDVHALAWQTTSRSRGRVKSERSRTCPAAGRSERREEVLPLVDHLLRVPVAGRELLADVERRLAGVRDDDVVDVVPLLAHMFRGARTGSARGRAPRLAVFALELART